MESALILVTLHYQTCNRNSNPRLLLWLCEKQNYASKASDVRSSEIEPLAAPKNPITRRPNIIHLLNSTGTDHNFLKMGEKSQVGLSWLCKDRQIYLHLPKALTRITRISFSISSINMRIPSQPFPITDENSNNLFSTVLSGTEFPKIPVNKINLEKASLFSLRF